jgi:DNA-binding GntR family transcriptional regulator
MGKRMMQRQPPVPAPLLSDPRRVSLELHGHLRRLIIDDRLPAGTILKQAELARDFGVSRGPLREAFRMLQEEGLIEVSVERAARVRRMSATELDQLYGVRIAVETLAIRISAGNLTGDEIAASRALINAMDAAAASNDVDAWMAAHREFHYVCIARADGPIQRVIRSFAERSERYLRLVPLGHPGSFELARAQHEELWRALVEGTTQLAGELIARHLADGGRKILEAVDPMADDKAIREALTMATRS